MLRHRGRWQWELCPGTPPSDEAYADMLESAPLHWRHHPRSMFSMLDIMLHAVHIAVAYRSMLNAVSCLIQTVGQCFPLTVVFGCNPFKIRA